jgi:hypothetical protein
MLTPQPPAEPATGVLLHHLPGCCDIAKSEIARPAHQQLVELTHLVLLVAPRRRATPSRHAVEPLVTALILSQSAWTFCAAGDGATYARPVFQETCCPNVKPSKVNVSVGTWHSRVFFSFTVSCSFAIICRIVASASSARPGWQQITKSSA